jgi:hypothetical protein
MFANLRVKWSFCCHLVIAVYFTSFSMLCQKNLATLITNDMQTFMYIALDFLPVYDWLKCFLNFQRGRKLRKKHAVKRKKLDVHSKEFKTVWNFSAEEAIFNGKNLPLLLIAPESNIAHCPVTP